MLTDLCAYECDRATFRKECFKWAITSLFPCVIVNIGAYVFNVWFGILISLLSLPYLFVGFHSEVIDPYCVRLEEDDPRIDEGTSYVTDDGEIKVKGE